MKMKTGYYNLTGETVEIVDSRGSGVKTRYPASDYKIEPKYVVHSRAYSPNPVVARGEIEFKVVNIITGEVVETSTVLNQEDCLYIVTPEVAMFGKNENFLFPAEVASDGVTTTVLVAWQDW